MITILIVILNLLPQIQTTPACPNSIPLKIDLSIKDEFERFNIEKAGLPYNKLLNFSEGIILIEIPSIQKRAYMDAQSNVIVLKQYADMYHFFCGRARVKSGAKYGYLNIEGKEVIPLKFDYAEDFRDGKALIGDYKEGLFYYINTEGRKL